MLQIGQAEGEQSSKVEIPRGAILDVEIWDTFLAVLFEKNLVQVYDLAQSGSSAQLTSSGGKSKAKKI